MFNTGSQADTKNKTWEASTLTGVLREQTRRDKNNLPVSSTCCRLNTDHKDVAMLQILAASSHTQKSIETKSEMLLIIVGLLLLGVLDVAVTCVHELVVFPPTSRRLRGSDIERSAAASSEARRVLVPFPW